MTKSTRCNREATSAGSPPGQTFPRALRLRRPAEFDRVFQRRKSVADARLVVYAAANALPHPRVGLVVGRRVGNAVRRNRWKRLLREAFRLERPQLPAGYDYILIPRGSQPPELVALRASLVRLARRAAAKAADHS